MSDSKNDDESNNDASAELLRTPHEPSDDGIANWHCSIFPLLPLEQSSLPESLTTINTLNITIIMSIHQAGTADGWHGIVPSTAFPAEPDRYHLYIGHFCPFAHRVNIVRHLKGLTDLIKVSVVRAYPKGDLKGWPGWKFPASDDEYPGATVDHLYGEDYLHKVYFRADPEYKGRYSVPLLWDTKTGTAVCNVCILPTLISVLIGGI